jgi:hypothetical protein
MEMMIAAVAGTDPSKPGEFRYAETGAISVSGAHATQLWADVEPLMTD